MFQLEPIEGRRLRYSISMTFTNVSVESYFVWTLLRTFNVLITNWS